MSYTFTQAQIDDITILFEIANDRVRTLGDANANYADVYAYIRDNIPASLTLYDREARRLG